MGFSSRWQELKPKGAPKGEPEVILVKIQEFEQTLIQFKEEATGIEKVKRHSVSVLRTFVIKLMIVVSSGLKF